MSLQTTKPAPCSDAFDGACPDCGHVFTLMDLARMARGDGFQRHIAVRLPDGTRAVVSFDELDPIRMQYWVPRKPTPMTEMTNAQERVEGPYWVEIKDLPSARWVVAEWSGGHWTVPGWIDEPWDDSDLSRIDERRLVRHAE